jgi:hypothetical protein
MALERLIAKAENQRELEDIPIYDTFFQPSHIEFYPEISQLRIPIWIQDYDLARLKRKVWFIKLMEVPTRLHDLLVYHAQRYFVEREAELDRHLLGMLRYFPERRCLSLFSNDGVRVEIEVSALRVELIKRQEVRWDWHCHAIECC